MELRMYAFRLYPSQEQGLRLNEMLLRCKCVYNELLGFNKKIFVANRKDLYGLVMDLKLCDPDLYNVNAQVLQNVAERLSKAFQSFFRRTKDPAYKKKGFPRFKSKVSSFTYPQNGFKLVSDKRLHLDKIGNVPIVLHRAPKGKVKTLTIKQNVAGQWYAIFCCETERYIAEHPSNKSVGIDVGLEYYATLSDGITIDNPRYFVKAEARVNRLQRLVSRKQKGSRNRRKAITRLAKAHLKVFNRRQDFLHQTSHRLTTQYKDIAVEKLNIESMVKHHRLAKHIGDASWSAFKRMLSYKAVTRGGHVIEVNARGTSTMCHKCGAVHAMSLNKRQFKCGCGIVVHRDLNAAVNIAGRAGLARTSTPVDTRPLPSIRGTACPVHEAGTIRDI